MRKLALLTAAAGMAVSGSLARADFVLNTSRTLLATGTFAGKEQVILTIQQGSGTAQTGNLISYDVALSSSATSPKFFIRTWDLPNGWFDTGAAPSENGNANADFGNQGLFADDGVNSRPGTQGSYVRWGNNTSDLGSYTRLQTTPAENSTTFTDAQSVTGFDVKAGEGGTTGVNAGVSKTLAVAIVPVGQPVTFSGVVSAIAGTAADKQFSITDPVVPEPASFSLFGIGAAGLLVRRRRQA